MTNTIIRRAAIKDVPQLLALGKEMHEESSYKQYSLNLRKLDVTLTSCIRDEMAIPLVAERDGKLLGGIIGFISSHYFGDDLVASDMAFFLTKEERKGRLGLKLLMAFIEEAKRLGADQISIGNSTGVDIDRIKKLYESLGLTHVGYQFHMRVK